MPCSRVRRARELAVLRTGSSCTGRRRRRSAAGSSPDRLAPPRVSLQAAGPESPEMLSSAVMVPLPQHPAFHHGAGSPPPDDPVEAEYGALVLRERGTTVGRRRSRGLTQNSYPPISEHGLIGDLQTAALVSTEELSTGCACPDSTHRAFASVLDADRGGRFRDRARGHEPRRQAALLSDSRGSRASCHPTMSARSRTSRRSTIPTTPRFVKLIRSCASSVDR